MVKSFPDPNATLNLLVHTNWKCEIETAPQEPKLNYKLLKTSIKSQIKNYDLRENKHYKRRL